MNSINFSTIEMGHKSVKHWNLQTLVQFVGILRTIGIM